ncbi:MAG TPA: hypothetical protein VNN73_20910 [Blastocatellia bacterium]|nr:hypothetical protein [Blastocatellia bacterium]
MRSEGNTPSLQFSFARLIRLVSIAPEQVGLPMNNLYFACTDCKTYVDAGYGWACWSLEETGIVTRGKPVSIERVLAAREYWNPHRTESADWLYKEVLPSVRQFLREHYYHRVIFGNTSDFLSQDGEDFLDWLQVGFMAQLLPRYFVERLGLKTWDEVRSFISDQTTAPWWWMLEWENLHDKARRKFQQLVESKSACQKRLACGPAD